jgi:hypothetical protein
VLYRVTVQNGMRTTWPKMRTGIIGLSWTYGREAAIRPNRLYLIDKKEVLASPQPFPLSQSISLVRRNWHFFVTFARLTAPVSVIFVTNGQGQPQKGKLE